MRIASRTSRRSSACSTTLSLSYLNIPRAARSWGNSSDLILGDTLISINIIARPKMTLKV